MRKRLPSGGIIGWWFRVGLNPYCMGQIMGISSDTALTLDRPCQANVGPTANYAARGCSSLTTACGVGTAGTFPGTLIRVDASGGTYGGDGRSHIERGGQGAAVGLDNTVTGPVMFSNISLCNGASICGGTINGADSLIEFGTGATDYVVTGLTPLGTSTVVIDNNLGPACQIGGANGTSFVRSATTTNLVTYAVDKNAAGGWTRKSTSSDVLDCSSYNTPASCTITSSTCTPVASSGGFELTVGATPGTTGTITFPLAAIHGWKVNCDDITTTTEYAVTTAFTSTTVSAITFYNRAGTITAPTASDTLSCSASPI